MLTANIIWFDKVGIKDVADVGGKNASIGEMIQHLTKTGIKVPMGFATTAQAYRNFLAQNNLAKKIYEILEHLDVDNIKELASKGQEIRELIRQTPFPKDFINDVQKAYEQLIKNDPNLAVAVRSSATAEDLAEASFAGQQETFLNIRGFENLLLAIKEVFASLYNDRAIDYRVRQKFNHQKIALSAGVQYMVRSDVGGSGVAFSIDTESGFADVVFINAALGLGETVVKGAVNPDEYYIYKPNLLTKKFAVLRKTLGEKAIKMIYRASKDFSSVTEVVKTTADEQSKFVLNDAELQELASYVLQIEQYYAKPMDIEWAKDGVSGEIFIVQARPETVKSRTNRHVLGQYTLKQKGKIIVSGRSVGQKIGQGKARILTSVSEMGKLTKGDVLVTEMTDPDWEPIMKKASAIVTDRGGRTCHAAIVARELGIPAIVGCTNATQLIQDGQDITASCAEGDMGYIYEGLLPFEFKEQAIDKMPELSVKIMLNIANPDQAFDFSFIPNFGVGLARLEFIISNMIGIHPNAVLNFKTLPAELQAKINHKIRGYSAPVNFYVEKMREGISTIAAAFYPKPVILRFSDFKSNEYANLLGGDLYEPKEENPMLGFRGASRYVHEQFANCFALECKAVKAVREDLGLTNVEVMIPFTRTVDELLKVLQVLEKNGLKRGENGLKIIMMCEIPSNVLIAEDFLAQVDGFSIGSNDLTQLTLGLDRDSAIVADLFDERNQAVKILLEKAIKACQKLHKYIGICGQGPSDHPDLAAWLLDQGIESMSLNPDSVMKTWLYIAKNLKK